MKKNMIVIAVLVAAFMVQANAFAKTVEGTVAKVDASAKKLNVNVTDASGTATEVTMAVTGSTQYAGIQNFEALNQGAKVIVEATEDPNGGWTAESVKTPEVAATPAQ